MAGRRVDAGPGGPDKAGETKAGSSAAEKRTGSEARRPPRRHFTGEVAQACVGAGLLLAWLFALLCFEGIVRNDPKAGFNRHDPFFLAATLAIAACGALAWFLPRFRLLASRAPRSRGAGCAVLAALLAVTLLMGVGYGLAPWQSVPYGIVAGAGFFLLVLGWFDHFSSYDVKVGGPLFSGTIVVMFVALMALFLFLFNGPRLTEYRTETRLLPCLFLVGSYALLRMVFRRAGGDGDASDAPLDEAPGSGMPAIVAKTAVFALVANFSGMFVWVYNIKACEDVFIEELLNNGLVPWAYAIAATAVVAIFLVIQLLSRRSGFVMVTFHRVLFLVLLFALATTLVVPAWFFTAYTAGLLAFFLAQMGVWTVLVRATYLFDCSPAKHISLVLAAQYLGDALAFVAFLAAPLPFWSGASGKLALVCLLVVTCVVFLFVFTEADVKVVDRVAVNDPRELFRDKCALIRERYGLTAREAEILELLARGKNAITIQEDLSISYGTIKTHKQSIYAKLDVHSQQELLAFVEGFDAPAASRARTA